MNRKLLILLGGVLAVIALGVGGFAVAVSTRPDELVVERSVSIQAPSKDVHAAVADYQHFKVWSPWDYDPDMVVEISEPSQGVGAWYTWKGNEKVGSGRMETTAMSDLQIEQDLEFIEPWAGKAEVTYRLEPSGEATTLTWSMRQELDFAGKAMGLLMDMDGMIGADFDKGLGRVRTLVESGEIGAPQDEAVEGAAAGGATDTDDGELTDDTDEGGDDGDAE